MDLENEKTNALEEFSGDKGAELTIKTDKISGKEIHSCIVTLPTQLSLYASVSDGEVIRYYFPSNCFCPTCNRINQI